MSPFLRDERGSIATMTAIFGTVICSLAALTVDLGSIALEGRTLQGAADLAAMSAAQNLDQATLAAQATAAANLDQVSVQVLVGRYQADPTKAPGARFAAGPDQPNAARVTLTRESPLYFGRWILGRDRIVLTRTATAASTAQPPRAMFSIGSRLARLDGGVANQLLSGLTGSSVSLSAIDYSALADAKVNLLGFSDALAMELGVEAGDYETLLTRQVDAGRALRVLRDLAGNQGDSALTKLVSASTGVTVTMGDLIGLQGDADEGIAQGLDASVSVLDLAMAMLETGGKRQAALSLGAFPGIASLSVDLAIGERPNRSPWLTVTGDGEPIIRTAQARLYVRARTAQKLSGLAQVDLPVVIELAASEARLDAIACEPRSVTLGVRPGVGKATIGAIDERQLKDFTRPLSPTPATLMSVLGLVTLTGHAEVEAADRGFRAVRFSDADISAGTLKTVTASGLTQGLIVSLVQRLDVTVKVIGLGLGLGGIVQALGVLLTPLGPVLDAAINPVFDLLGLHFGQADVRVHDATCPDETARRAVLVG
ncbi:MAG: TadG family pilus assembly protein [Pseudomonadota bacterium]